MGRTEIEAHLLSKAYLLRNNRSSFSICLIGQTWRSPMPLMLCTCRRMSLRVLLLPRWPQALAALAEGGPASRPEEGDQGRRNSQGQKGHFPCFSLLESPEMNILFGPVSTSKFVRNQSVHQQIVKFCMPASKEGSLGMSGSKISQI